MTWQVISATKNIGFVTLSVLLNWALLQSCNGDEKPDGGGTRPAWTSSQFKGSPDTPLPLALVPAFPELKFHDPMHVRWQAELERYFVCELGGKVWSFSHNSDVSSADLVVDLKASLKSFDAARSGGCDNLFSLIFDPDFARNRFVYLCFVLSNKTKEPMLDGSRISRFRVTEETPPKIDIDSELPIITWLGGGHNGCDMAFDQEGYLYFSTGDATDPSPPDRLKTGQDVSDLLASVLRIDVRGAKPGQPYQIPSDNPFRDLPNARPEIWAFGFRNPWRIAIDPPTGQMWLGDVGWEKWELIHRVERGGNYGWSVREGHELLQPNAPLGPTPILPTRIAISHADAASITGGFVYRGNALPAIQGQYLFGDWITGRVWSVPLNESSLHREVASGQLRIIAFSPDRDGEPLVVNHFNGTSLFRLVANADYASDLANMQSFPRNLSQTGIFRDVQSQEVSDGVRGFSINQPMWHDGATGKHFIALPQKEKATVFNEPQPVGSMAMFNSRLHYPSGTVFAKTLSIPRPNGNARSESEHKIETQVLHFDGRLWHGYSYIWNQEQTDAELAPAAGQELTLPVPSKQRWRVHSRTECMQCHNPWPETTLAFTPEQLHQPDKGSSSTLLSLVREGYVETLTGARQPVAPEKCVSRPLSSSRSDPIESRARSYLHANCAHCHQNGAGAAVELSLKITDSDKALKAIGVAPIKGSLGLKDGKLINPGDPLSSIVLFRMASSSTGRMPHIGSREVDFSAVALVSDWIKGMASSNIEPLEIKAVDAKKLADGILAGGAEPQEVRSRWGLELAVHLARTQAQEKYLPLSVLQGLSNVPDPLVSSLFESFLPAEQRLRRLGLGATYAEIAEIVGRADAGEAWFFDRNRSQCAACHRVGERGGQVGPDLLHIGKKYSPAQLFESLVDPSRTIEPKYESHTVLLSDGKVVTGLLHESTATQLTLINAQGEKILIDMADIESRKLDSKSIMPSGLASELTAQQAADLLSYLSSLH